jgi:hypothetical protein
MTDGVFFCLKMKTIADNPQGAGRIDARETLTFHPHQVKQRACRRLRNRRAGLRPVQELDPDGVLKRFESYREQVKRRVSFLHGADLQCSPGFKPYSCERLYEPEGWPVRRHRPPLQKSQEAENLFAG